MADQSLHYLQLVRGAYGNVLQILDKAGLRRIGNRIYRKGYPVSPTVLLGRDDWNAILYSSISIRTDVVKLMELAHSASPHVRDPWRMPLREALEELERAAREWDERCG